MFPSITFIASSRLEYARLAACSLVRPQDSVVYEFRRSLMILKLLIAVISLNTGEYVFVFFGCSDCKIILLLFVDLKLSF